MQRKPFSFDRSQGERPSSSMNIHTAWFHAPPRVNRFPDTSFEHHSFTLPAMSSVPYAPRPWYEPTGAGPMPLKLLNSSTSENQPGLAARCQW